jgi:hypothetical protein
MKGRGDISLQPFNPRASSTFTALPSVTPRSAPLFEGAVHKWDSVVGPGLRLAALFLNDH